MLALALGYAKGLALVTAVLVGWVAVERAWRRAFGVTDEERNRTGACGGCTCTRRCERRTDEGEAATAARS